MSAFSAIANVVKDVAPLLGTALGGPIGGIAASLVASAFGGSSSDLDGLLSKIQTDPDAQVKLRQIDAEIASINAQREQQQEVDTAGARTQYMEMTKILGHPQKMIAILSLIVTVGFFIDMGTILYLPMESSDIDMIKNMNGGLISILTSVFHFWFSSYHDKS